MKATEKMQSIQNIHKGHADNCRELVTLVLK